MPGSWASIITLIRLMNLQPRNDQTDFGLGAHVRQVAPMSSQPPDARGGTGGKAAGKGGGEKASRKEDKGAKVSFDSLDKSRGQAKPGAKSSPLGGGGPLGKRPSISRLVRRMHAAWALISCLRLSRDVRRRSC